MKRILIPIAAALVLTALAPGAAFGVKPSLRSGALLNDPAVTPKVEAELRQQAAEQEAQLGIDSASGEIGISGLNSYGLLTRPVTLYRQETSYWCGPASARQALSFHRTWSGSSVSLPSQSTLAVKIGTTTSGSTTTQIVSALNSYDGTFGEIGYLASNITDTPNPYESFVNRIGVRLRPLQSHPTTPVTLMQTKYIPRYSGKESRHYMTICGIDDRTAPMRMRDADPNGNSAYYGVYWDPVGNTTANGLCRACYEADRAGTNVAMAW